MPDYNDSTVHLNLFLDRQEFPSPGRSENGRVTLSDGTLERGIVERVEREAFESIGAFCRFFLCSIPRARVSERGEAFERKGIRGAGEEADAHFCRRVHDARGSFRIPEGCSERGRGTEAAGVQLAGPCLSLRREEKRAPTLFPDVKLASSSGSVPLCATVVRHLISLSLTGCYSLSIFFSPVLRFCSTLYFAEDLFYTVARWGRPLGSSHSRYIARPLHPFEFLPWSHPPCQILGPKTGSPKVPRRILDLISVKYTNCGSFQVAPRLRDY